VLLPNCWLVVRIDGKCFHKFTKTHEFEKPNDWRALALMNRCSMALFEEFPDIVYGFGQSDEYSFILHKSTKIYGRRSSKIQSLFVSHFTSCYVYYWEKFMKKPLQYPPIFDSRVVCYPSLKNIRDYISWRQVDCHINNLYNTCFWTLVLKGGRTEKEAEKELSGTRSENKNELLFSQFNLNYNNEPPMFRKGSVTYRELVQEGNKHKKKKRVVIVHEDVIGEDFWKRNPNILSETARDATKCFGGPPIIPTPHDPLVVSGEKEKEESEREEKKRKGEEKSNGEEKKRKVDEEH